MLEFFVVTVPFPGNQGYCFHSGILFNERVLNSEEQTDGVMTGPLRAVVNYHATVVVRRIIYIYHPRFQQVRGNEKSKSNFKEGNQGLSLQTVLVHSYL